MRPRPMRVGDPEVIASDSIVRRIQLLAQFIAERHPGEFGEYWADKWPGQAQASETLNFFADPDLVNKVILHQKVVL